MVHNTYKHTPRSTAHHSCARVRPYTHAVHKTSRSERCCSQNCPSRKNKLRFSIPSKRTGGLMGTKKKPSLRRLHSIGAPYYFKETTCFFIILFILSPSVFCYSGTSKMKAYFLSLKHFLVLKNTKLRLLRNASVITQENRPPSLNPVKQ